MASASNVIYVALGPKSAVKKLDVGRMMVTLYRLVNDTQFIQQIKEEFVFNGFNQLIQGEG
jgi:hypothetical protein